METCERCCKSVIKNSEIRAERQVCECDVPEGETVEAMIVKDILALYNERALGGYVEGVMHRNRSVEDVRGGIDAGCAEIVRRIIKPLIEHSSKLAALACCVDGGLVGDEGGHTYCTMWKKLSTAEKHHAIAVKAIGKLNGEVGVLKLNNETLLIKNQALSARVLSVEGAYAGAVNCNKSLTIGTESFINEIGMLQVKLDGAEKRALMMLESKNEVIKKLQDTNANHVIEAGQAKCEAANALGVVERQLNEMTELKDKFKTVKNVLDEMYKRGVL